MYRRIIMTDSDNNLQTEKTDIFDRIMALPFFRLFEKPYKEYKDILLYLFFGVLTTLVNFVVFFLLGEKVAGLNVHIANSVAWVAGVAFAYVTNRTWVFKEHADTRDGIIKEVLSFTGGRLFTYGFEEAMLLIFVTWLKFDEVIIKIIAAIGVVVLNYIISKVIVFRKGKNEVKK